MVALIISLQADVLGKVNPIVSSGAFTAFEAPGEESEAEDEDAWEEIEAEPAADSRVSAGAAIPTGSQSSNQPLATVSPSAVATKSNRAVTLYASDDLPDGVSFLRGQHRRSTPSDDQRTSLIRRREAELKQHFDLNSMHKVIRQNSPKFTNPSQYTYPLALYVDARENMPSTWNTNQDSASEYRLMARYDVLVFTAKRSVDCQWRQVEAKDEELFFIVHAVAINLSNKDVFLDLTLKRDGVYRLDKNFYVQAMCRIFMNACIAARGVCIEDLIIFPFGMGAYMRKLGFHDSDYYSGENKAPTVVSLELRGALAVGLISIVKYEFKEMRFHL